MPVEKLAPYHWDSYLCRTHPQPTRNMLLFERITTNPDVHKGRPTIRNMRFTVAAMLELLAGGMTPQEIMEDYPYIEPDDIRACLMYAAMLATNKTMRPLPS